MRFNVNELLDEAQAAERKEKWLKLWHRFGFILILIFVAFLASIAIYSWQSHRNHMNNIAISERFEEGKNLLIKNERINDAIKILEEVSQKEKSVYSTMASFLLGDFFEKANQPDRAYVIYQKIMRNKKTDLFYRQLAELNTLRLDDNQDKGKADEQIKALDVILKTDSAIKGLALEMKAYLLYKKQELKKARAAFVQLAQMERIDSGLRERAQSMARLIGIQSTKEGGA